MSAVDDRRAHAWASGLIEFRAADEPIPSSLPKDRDDDEELVQWFEPRECPA